MANEFSVTTSLILNNGSYQYRPPATTFQATQSTPSGPTPGAIHVTTAGTDVNLSQIGSPGLCRIANLDTPGNGNQRFVIYGMHDQTAGTFEPLGEVLPGEFFVFRLYRYLGAAFGTGTGTGKTLRIRAVGGNVDVELMAFGR